MAAPDNSLERLALAAVGVVALTADRIEELASELAERGGMRRDEARALLDSAVSRWRGDATRIGERAGDSFSALLTQLGVVTREDFDELELRARAAGAPPAADREAARRVVAGFSLQNRSLRPAGLCPAGLR